MDINLLKLDLKRDEGVKPRIYTDTVGKISGGVGRNLSDVPFSNDEMELMLANDIKRSVADLDKFIPWWRNLNEVRQRVVINLCFNMGIGNSKKGLLSFVNTLNFMMRGDYKAAAAGMRNSKWYGQVGLRGERLAKQMETGV